MTARRSRSVLAWGLVVAATAQLLGVAALEASRPEVVDYEFDRRLELARNRLADHPNEPLLAVQGSSRLAKAFAPEHLPPLTTAAGAPVVPLNLSFFGAGPVLNRVELNRLLQAGVKPRWLVLEVMPNFLCHETLSLIARRVTAAELPIVAESYPALDVGWNYLRGRVPVSPRRLRQMLGWEPLGSEWDPVLRQAAAYAPLGGFPALHAELPPEVLAHELAEAKFRARSCLQNYAVAPGGDRALRATLDECRRNGITVVLLLTPEGPVYRSWYSAAAVATVERYVRALGCEYAAPVVDARDWLPETDFYDSHHVLLSGAIRFTTRLGAEVLTPLVRDEPIGSLLRTVEDESRTTAP